MTIEMWLLYLVTEITLIAIPGPAVLLVSAQGLKYGSRSSLYGAFGISSANALFFFLSAFGLGTIIINAGSLFEWIKYVGAAYLVFTGMRTILYSFKKESKKAVEPVEKHGFLFVQAFVTQASNPKAILFFVALLPQFVDATANVAAQFLILGTTTIVVETLILFAYGWLAGKSKALLRTSESVGKIQNWVVGCILILLGVNLLWLDTPND
ncbi:MAG TPA: LysE family translocator [Bacteroidota bacterium]|nr:LysE family translocator [Bacteroidota bacterium]